MSGRPVPVPGAVPGAVLVVAVVVVEVEVEVAFVEGLGRGGRTGRRVSLSRCRSMKL